MTLIGVHELHGQIHPNQGNVHVHVTNLLLLTPSHYLAKIIPHSQPHPSCNWQLALWLLGNGKQMNVHVSVRTPHPIGKSHNNIAQVTETFIDALCLFQSVGSTAAGAQSL